MDLTDKNVTGAHPDHPLGPDPRLGRNPCTEFPVAKPATLVYYPEAIPEHAEAASLDGLYVEFVPLTDAEIDAQIGPGPEHIAVVLRQAFREGRYVRESNGDLHMTLTNQECITIGLETDPSFRLAPIAIKEN